jgi:hypothetical protein
MCLGLSSGISRLNFPIKIVYTFLMYILCVLHVPVHVILIYLIILIINYRIINFNTVQCDSISIYLPPLHVSVSKGSKYEYIRIESLFYTSASCCIESSLFAVLTSAYNATIFLIQFTLYSLKCLLKCH